MHLLQLFWISLFSTVLLVAINQFNLNELYPIKNKELISTADEPSYFAPAINFIENGVWKDNSTGYSSYYQRPPGYGFLFYVAKRLSNNNPFLSIKIIQILLFGISIYLFGLILKVLKIKDKSVCIYTLVYGILPFFSTFTYFTLTESILPFILITLLYLTLKFSQKRTIKSILVLGLFSGLSLLVRPQIAFLLFPTLVICLLQLKKLKLHLALFLALIIIPFFCWNIRNYQVNNEWVGIHPIYHYSNNHMYRPIHKEMSDLFRIWESNSANFHSNMAILFSDTTHESRVQVLHSIPTDIRTKYQTNLNASFKKYQIASFELRNNFKRETFLKQGEIKTEVSAIKELRLLTQKIKKDFWFTNHIKTPIFSLKEFLASSHLGLFIYQSTFKGNSIMEIFRWCSFIFLFSIFISSIVVLFISNLNTVIRLVLATSFLYLFYLVYFQRMNEERYYYILFPLFFVGSITLLHHFIQRKRSA